MSEVGPAKGSPEFRQAGDLLAEGRLTVAHVDGRSAAAMCREGQEAWAVGFEVDRGWYCDRDEAGGCVHIGALQLLTGRALSRPVRESEGTGAPARGTPDGDGRNATSPTPAEHEHEEERRAAGPAAPRWVLTFLLVAALAAGAGWAISRGLATPGDDPQLAGPPDPPLAADPAAPPIASPSLPPEVSPPQGTPSETTTVRFPQPASGNGLLVRVQPFTGADRDCTSHVFDGVGAYQSDCRSWQGTDVSWFFVFVENTGADPVSVRLGGLVMATEVGERRSPVRLGVRSTDPQAFFPREAELGPGEGVGGWVTFDDDPDVVPASLTYQDGGGTALTIEFAGGHDTLPPG